MPIQQPIVDTVIPRDVPKPLPVRTISTRNPVIQKDGNQVATIRNDLVADTATPAESVKLSPQLSALARKEQAFRQRELAFKQREKDLEEKLKKAEQFEQLSSKMSSKDYSEAEKLGLDYEAYTNYKLNQSADKDPNAEELAAIKQELQDMKKKQEESSNQAFEETVQAWREDLTSTAASDQFSNLRDFKREGSDGKTFSGVEVALHYLMSAWEEDGRRLSAKEALEETQMLLKKESEMWTPFMEKPKEEERRLPPPRSGVNTLTNQMQPQGEISRPHKSLQHLSESERYAEARRRVLARRQPQGA